MLNTFKSIVLAIPFVVAAAGTATAGEAATVQSNPHTAMAAKQGAGGSPLTLNIERPAGDRVRLLYVQPVGWRHAAN